MMWGNGFGMGWGTWLVMGGCMLAFWLVVVLAIWALLPGRDRTNPGGDRPDPLTLLKEGLARGEVTPEDYEQRRRLIVDGH